MKKSELQRITNGMAQGRGEFTITDNDGNERQYNIAGATNALLHVLEDVEDYNLSYSDLTAEQQEEVDLAQQALQYHMSEIPKLLSSFAGNDGAIEDENGNQLLDLPNAASNADTNVGVPSSN